MRTIVQTPRHIPRDPDGVSINGSRKTRKTRIVPLPFIEKDNSKSETFEQSPERPGPDSAEADTPDVPLTQLDRDKRD
jgi:hypothetical protein